MMADTFPKMLAYIRAGEEPYRGANEPWWRRVLMRRIYLANHHSALCVGILSRKDLLNVILKPY